MIDPYKRQQVWKFRGRGPTGKPLCYCGCGNEVSPPRRTCFSDACITDWKQRNDPATIRRAVERRDQGICAICGVDTVQRAKSVGETRLLWERLAIQHATELFDAGQLPMFPGFTPSEKSYAEYRRSAEQGRIHAGDIHKWAYHWVDTDIREKFGKTAVTHCWEADHIVPVCEGGGGCGPEGYRTLCLPCHKRQTALLAARRAEKRRQAVPPVPQLNLI